MILYEFPQPLDRQGRQVKALHDIEYHKKMQKNMYKNLILAGIIISTGFFANIMIIKVILWLIGIGNAVTAILLYNVSSLSNDTKIYTRIYNDKIEHCQADPLTESHTYVTFFYEDALESYQNNCGDLMVRLKGNYKTKVFHENKNGKKEIRLKNNLLKLRFRDTKAKIFLVENLYEQIKYPHKEYNVIHDEEDDDDFWDPLHKHGL